MSLLIFMAIYLMLAYYKIYKILILISNFFLLIIALVNKDILLIADI